MGKTPKTRSSCWTGIESPSFPRFCALQKCSLFVVNADNLAQAPTSTTAPCNDDVASARAQQPPEANAVMSAEQSHPLPTDNSAHIAPTIPISLPAAPVTKFEHPAYIVTCGRTVGVFTDW